MNTRIYYYTYTGVFDNERAGVGLFEPELYHPLEGNFFILKEGATIEQLMNETIEIHPVNDLELHKRLKRIHHIDAIITRDEDGNVTLNFDPQAFELPD